MAELKTYGDLKKAIRAINLKQKGEKISGVAVGVIMGLIPGADAAKNTYEFIKAAISKPDTKKTNTWLDKLDIDDEMSAIVDDTVENGFMQAMSAAIEAEPDDKPLEQDFNMNAKMVNYLKQQHKGRTISGIQENKDVKLKEYIKQLAREIMSEDGGAIGNTTAALGGGAGVPMTPNWVAPKGQKKNAATKTAEKQGFKVTKGETEAPGDSKIKDYEPIWKSAKKKKVKIYQESNYTKRSVSSNPSLYLQPSGYTGPSLATKGGGYYAVDENINEMDLDKKPGKRYIPTEFELPSFLLEPLKFGEADEPRKYFKIISKGDEYILLIDPLVKTSFDEIERGRTTFSKEKKLFPLTRFIKEKVPQDVRGLMKKYSQGVKASIGGFIPLPLVLMKRGDKYFVKNPSTTPDSLKTDIGTSLYENIATSTPENIEKAINLYSKAAKKYKEEENESLYNKAIEIIHFLNNKYEEMTGENYLKAKGISSLQETLQNIIEEELLNEVTYSKFKNEVKFRTKNEQLHKAIREVKHKLMEIDRIVEYTSRMKQELSEGEEGLKYWKNTEKNIATISEMVNTLNNKIKNLHQ